MQIIVCLPAYNEAARIGQLLDRLDAALRGGGYRVVVVDDGSADDTVAILERRRQDLPLTVLRHAQNQGLADTLRDGLVWAAANSADDDVIVTMDADDTHDPVYVAEMLRRIAAGADVVIASRFRPGSQVKGVPPHRQLFSFGVLVLLKLLLPIRGVRDYACGYRAVRATLVKRAVERFGERLFELKRWGFICTAELLWRLHTLGARCDEVPFVLRYDLKESESRMRAGRTIAGYGLLVLRAWGVPLPASLVERR